MELQDTERKVYEAPAVVYEAPLEVRAGSPLGISPMNPADLLGAGQD